MNYSRTDTSIAPAHGYFTRFWADWGWISENARQSRVHTLADWTIATMPGIMYTDPIMLTTIAFDADDTLWHNETHYRQASQKLTLLLSDFADPATIENRLAEIEIRNVPRYGYGIKSYTLSMIETAIDLSGGRISSGEIGKVLTFGQEMLSAKVMMFGDTESVLTTLSKNFTLMLVTKGDLLEQDEKINRSGIADFFTCIEIVREKTPAVYRRLLKWHNIPPAEFLMVGNSLVSDIYPVLEIGGQAVYVPYELTWSQELPIDGWDGKNTYHEIEHLGMLPEFIASLQRQ